MDVLDRLYDRLQDAVRRTAPDALDRPLTIADIYQHFVPYRLVRAELGFGELKEYEHALLRLLAGERGYVRVDLPQVVEEFRRELRSPNPILGIYRDYAAVGVSLSAAPRPAAEPAAAAIRPVEAQPDGSGERARPEPPAVAPAAAPAPPAPDLAAADVTLPEPPTAPRRAACWHCREPLPQNRDVRFCPHCGAGQVPTPCAECETLLEPGWRFCIQCGARQAEPQPVGSAG